MLLFILVQHHTELLKTKFVYNGFQDDSNGVFSKVYFVFVVFLDMYFGCVYWSESVFDMSQVLICAETVVFRYETRTEIHLETAICVTYACVSTRLEHVFKNSFYRGFQLEE